MEQTVQDDLSTFLKALPHRQESLIEYAEIEIESDDVLLLNTAPADLVPGRAGTVVEFVSMALILDHGGTNYATNGDLYVKTKTTGTVLSDTVAGGDFLFAAADAARVVQVLSADTQLDPGEGLVLQVGTGNPTAGDGILRVKVAYRRHKTGLA